MAVSVLRDGESIRNSFRETYRAAYPNRSTPADVCSGSSRESSIRVCARMGMDIMNHLDGQTFHRLTVIERGGSTRGKAILWMCHCECGNTVYATAAQLRSGNTKSCGCWRGEYNHRIDLSGQKFGLLTVLRPVADDKTTPSSRARTWECVCACGNVKHVKGWKLKRFF